MSRLLRAHRAAGGSRRLLAPQWVDFGVVTADRTLTWTIDPPQPVGANYSITYSIVSAVGADRSFTWTTRHSVGRDLYLDWYIGEGRVVNTRNLYPFRAPSTLNRMLRQIGRAPSPRADLTLIWNSGGVVTRDFPLSWQIDDQGAGIGDPLGDPFVTTIAPIAAAGEVAFTSPLDVVLRDLALQWQIGDPGNTAVNPTGDPFIVFIAPIVAQGTVAFTSDTTTTTVVGNSLPLQWQVRNAAGLSRALTWGINTSAEASLTLTWGITEFTTASADLVLAWQTRHAAGLPLDLSWNVLRAVGAAQPLAWTILEQGAVGLEQMVRWNVLQSARADAQFSWASAGRQWSDLNMRWRLGIRPAIDAFVVMRDGDALTAHASIDAAIAHVSHQQVNATPVRF